MPTIKAASKSGTGTKAATSSTKKTIGGKKAKPAPQPRTMPRVTDTEDKSHAATKSATHKNSEPPLTAVARNLGGGQVLITAQQSELVPIAQYANVTLGPNQLAWVLSADMSILAEADWDDPDAELTDEQQAVYDLVMGALKASSSILQVHLSEDREIVLHSVQEANAREASEQKSKKSSSRARRS